MIKILPSIVIVETGSCHAAEADLELAVSINLEHLLLLPLPPQDWDCKLILPHPTSHPLSPCSLGMFVHNPPTVTMLLEDRDSPAKDPLKGPEAPPLDGNNPSHSCEPPVVWVIQPQPATAKGNRTDRSHSAMASLDGRFMSKVINCGCIKSTCKDHFFYFNKPSD